MDGLAGSGLPAKNVEYLRLRHHGGGADEIFENRILSEWLNTKEAASYLSLSPNALRIMVHRGKVRAYKFGSRLRFRMSDLASLLFKGVECHER